MLLRLQMALLSALFSLIGRQLSTILQAIFGWSITALFGRLPPRKQTALTVALVLSVAWPLLVLGCFLPAAAAWAVALVPLHKWMSDLALRLLWITLAVLVPLGVGAITRWVTPKEKLHGGLIVTLLGGYVMTIGYFIAFVVTAFTVPIVKVLSMIHRWDDCHVYVQPKEGRYDDALEALVEACRRAGSHVEREDVPTPMALATRVIQKLAKPFLEPLVASNPQRLRGENLELYLYPADLLLRGEPHLLAHVRAAMTRTDLEKVAYLVQTPEAQKIQDEIRILWDKREKLAAMEGGLTVRIRTLSQRLDHAPISFEEWITLEANLRRVVRAITGDRDLLEGDSDAEPSAPLERSSVTDGARPSGVQVPTAH